MNEKIAEALAQDRVVDITTIGRKSGQPRRIEIWFHRWNGRYYITGLPGRRSWYANLRAHSDFTFHLKESLQADLPARATPVTAETERREILSGITRKLGRSNDLEGWVARSPLVEIEFLN